MPTSLAVMMVTLAVTTPGWITYGIALGGLIVAIGTAWTKVLNPIRKFANRVEAMYPLLVVLTDTFKDTPHAFKVLDEIVIQFRTDSGSSLRDVVNRLEAMGEANARQVEKTKAAADMLAIGVEAARMLAVRDREELSRLLLQQDRSASKIDAAMRTLDELRGGQVEMNKQASDVATNLVSAQLAVDAVASNLLRAQGVVDEVAVDLAASHARADAVADRPDGAPGEAADAGAQSPEKGMTE